MSVQIKTVDLKQKRNGFGHIARRMGADKPASRYLEATLDIQATENFHYKPLWEPEFWHYDPGKTAVVMQDWYKPLDPRQYYYAAYNITRANMHQAVERNFNFVDERSLLTKASAEARGSIQLGLLPLRHLHWGSNMNMAEICNRGYGAAITSPCIFSACDHLGMAQIISRIGLLLDEQTGRSLDEAKIAWINDSAFQGLRKLIEDTFVERDWFHLFVAQALGVNAVIWQMVYRLAETAWKDAGLNIALLSEFMTDWLAEESRWSDHVIKIVAAESEHNKNLISGWAAHWIGRSMQAAHPWSEAFLGDSGSSAREAAEGALQRAAGLGLAV